MISLNFSNGGYWNRQDNLTCIMLNNTGKSVLMLMNVYTTIKSLGRRENAGNNDRCYIKHFMISCLSFHLLE